MSNTLHPIIAGIKKQRTYAMVKPDGVSRGLAGEILSRIEKAGLKIVAMKMIIPSREVVMKHLPLENLAWIDRLGDKGLNTFSDLSLDATEFLGTSNKTEIGNKVVDSLIDYLTSGPVICLVIEGIQAIDMVRKLAGHTLPFKAEMGTIRGDFSVDSPAIANVEGRAIHNLFHASETLEEATNEIALWFGADSALNYNLASEDVMYSKTY